MVGQVSRNINIFGLTLSASCGQSSEYPDITFAAHRHRAVERGGKGVSYPGPCSVGGAPRSAYI